MRFLYKPKAEDTIPIFIIEADQEDKLPGTKVELHDIIVFDYTNGETLEEFAVCAVGCHPAVNKENVDDWKKSAIEVEFSVQDMLKLLREKYGD